MRFIQLTFVLVGLTCLSLTRALPRRDEPEQREDGPGEFKPEPKFLSLFLNALSSPINSLLQASNPGASLQWVPLYQLPSVLTTSATTTTTAAPDSGDSGSGDSGSSDSGSGDSGSSDSGSGDSGSSDSGSGDSGSSDSGSSDSGSSDSGSGDSGSSDAASQ